MKTVGIDMTYVKNIDGVSGEEVFALALLNGFYNAGKQLQITVFVLESLNKQILLKYPGLHVISVKKGGPKFYNKTIKKQLKKNLISH